MRSLRPLTVLRIYTHDVRRIVSNWVTLTVICGLILLPSLYAWINIYASWDPYSNTRGLKVGIVNNDTGGTLKGIRFNIGDEIVHSLKENTKLGWTFYNTADEGIAKADNGEVYATIVIPDDFSLKMSTILNEQPVKPELEYYVNEKENAIASKMTDAGASTIQREISSSFIETVTTKVFEALNKAGVELEQQYPEIERYKNLLYTLNDKMPQLNQNLNGMLDNAENGFVRLDKAAGHVPALQDTLGKFIELDEGLSKDLLQASSDLKDKAPEIKENLQLLQSVSSKLAAMTDDLNNRLTLRKPEVLTQLDQAVADMDRLQQRLNDTSAKLEKAGVVIPDETAALMGDMIRAADSYKSLLQNLKRAAQGAGSVAELLSAAQPLNDRLLKQVTQLETAVGDLLLPLDKALNTTTAAQILNHLEQIRKLAEEVSSLTGTLQSALAYTKSDLDAKLADSISQADYVQKRIYDNSNALAQSSAAGAFQLSKDMKALSQRLGDWKTGTADLRKAIAQNRSLEGLLPDLTQLNTNISNGAGRAIASLDQTVLPQLTNSLPKQSLLLGDVGTVLSNTQEDLAAAKDLMTQLSSGGRVAVDDIRNFQQRVPNLQQSISDLTAKFRSLENTLDLKDLIRLMKNQGIAETGYLANPVTINTHALYPIANYGAGMTPFYTTLCLWVGSLLLSSLLTVTFKPAGFSYTPHEEFLGKYMLFATLSVLQGLIVALGDLFLLRVHIVEPALFVALTLVYCLVFSMIIFTLVSLFHNIGKSIGVILLVLQLAGSGGTFPIQVTPVFFQVIHSMLPFTYAISGMREALAGVNFRTLTNDLGILAVFFAGFLVAGYLFKPALTAFLGKYSKQLHDSGVIGH